MALPSSSSYDVTPLPPRDVQFLSAFTLRAIMMWQLIPSVRQSVCLSVTLRYCIKTAKLVEILSPPYRPIDPGFCDLKFQYEILRLQGHP